MITFGFESALKVMGPQALVNRWLKTFLTPRGSDPTDLNIGTLFGQLIESNTHSVEDLKDSVFLAVTDANDQVKQQDIVGLYSQDERLRDATLLGVDVSNSDASLTTYIRIVNLAGLSLTVKLATQGDR